MSIIVTVVEWTAFALAVSWAICTNITLRQHYKNSDLPALPENATALAQLVSVVVIAAVGYSPFHLFGCFRLHISPAFSPYDPGSSVASHGFTATWSPTQSRPTGNIGGSMTTGLTTTVTNVATRKKYFVSTVEEPRVGGWQTAVFRKIFGTLANFHRPAFFLGCSPAERASYQHARVATIVRDVDPADWEEASSTLSKELIEEDVQAEMAENEASYFEMLRMFK